MSDSRSRRFATWAFPFKPLEGNLRIAAATHISTFLSRKAEIGKERIQQVLPRRRTEIGPQAAAHSADLIQQASRNRERASPPSRACPSARCSTPGTTGSEACSSAKRAAWRGALPQEPREANPSGRPATRETRSPEALFPR